MGQTHSKPLFVSCLLTSHWLNQVTWLHSKGQGSTSRHEAKANHVTQHQWVGDVYTLPMEVKGEGREFVVE